VALSDQRQAMSSLTSDAAGLGLRRGLIGPLLEAPAGAFDFLECAPDNWIGVGGLLGEQLQTLATRHPLTCHGLSLSLGGFAPLDEELLQRTRAFLDRHGVTLYSEHLSWCSDDGQLYELMPLPFTEEAVRHVAARIRRVQDVLGRRIAVENVSYYTELPSPGHARLSEPEFVRAVLHEADCDLLLDVNNVHVNAINQGYDARDFIDAMPSSRIASYHVAGHHDEAPGLKIDSHGRPVHTDTWDLLAHTYARHGVRPTLLERDFNLPPLAQLLEELQQVRALQRVASSQAATHV
jgi:uncharacterized protein (UPF0276 family)